MRHGHTNVTWKRVNNRPSDDWKTSQNRSKVKVLMTIFFNFRSTVHFQYLPPVHAINKKYCHSVLKHLKNFARQKRPELWLNNSWVLHDDNVPSHQAGIMLDYFTKHQVNTTEPTPWLPYLASCDLPSSEKSYYLFGENDLSILKQ